MAEDTPHIEPTFTDKGSLAPAYFDDLYAASPDPWAFATSAYETQKYAATLAALPRKRYASALELGCSIGVLTQQLAARCDHLLALDVSELALGQARRRCADLPQVTFERRDLAEQFPQGRFDLILISEVAYYFSRPVLTFLRARIAAALNPSAHLLLVHYVGGTNYPLTADAVHETFLEWEDSVWKRLLSRVADDYRLDLLENLP